MRHIGTILDDQGTTAQVALLARPILANFARAWASRISSGEVAPAGFFTDAWEERPQPEVMGPKRDVAVMRMLE